MEKINQVDASRLIQHIKAQIPELMAKFAFNINDEETRATLKADMNEFLQNIKEQGVLYEFMVWCDETNNSPLMIDNNEIRVDVMFKPNAGYMTHMFGKMEPSSISAMDPDVSVEFEDYNRAMSVI